MKTITFQEAKERRLPSYFTGQPCPHGHIAPRRTINRSCTECNAIAAKKRYEEKKRSEPYLAAARERAAHWAADNPVRYKKRQKQWREKNKEKAREYGRAWREKNRATIKERRRQKRLANPELERERRKHRYSNPAYAQKAKVRAKKWRENNPARQKQMIEEWKQRHPLQAKQIQRTGSINRRARINGAGNISSETIEEIRARRVCAICGNEHPHMEIDHKIALSRGGSNHKSNLQLLCRPCNRSKWAKDQDTWLAEQAAKIR